MPSPFPGMDPYIESRGFWPDFHQRVITGCSEALDGLLPEQYAARIEEQIRLIHPEDDPKERRYVPDVAIDRDENSGASVGRSAGIATIEPTTMTIALQELEEIHESWIEIIRFPERSVVTVIELLSPTNKAANGRGDYLDKRRRVLESPAHFVEIDLLIGGDRPLMSNKRPWPPGQYYALVSRTEDRPDCKVYGWSIRQPIPPIPIPLAHPDPDVMLDLVPIVARAYNRGRYGRDLRYDQPLDLPLAPEERAWAEEITKPVQKP